MKPLHKVLHEAVSEATVTPAVTSTSTVAGGGRTYRFTANWLKMSPWLELENNVMFCKYCRRLKQAGNPSFGSGKRAIAQRNITSVCGISSAEI
jgi:hypothetical protein